MLKLPRPGIGYGDCRPLTHTCLPPSLHLPALDWLPACLPLPLPAVLTGPVRALTFLLIYGLLSLALGACWAWRLPWWLSIPAGALVRIAGYATYVLLSSWALGENLGALMVANAHALLDQMSAALGASGAPSPAAVLVTLASLLFVHSLFYVSLLHVFYAILLRGLGLDMGWERMPRFVQRMLGGLPDGSAAELGTTH